MKYLTTILLLASLGVMGQSKNNNNFHNGLYMSKPGDKKRSPGKRITIQDALPYQVFADTNKVIVFSSGVNWVSKPDTVQAYFKEIKGVKDGELVTRWVNGFKTLEPYNPNIGYVRKEMFLYPDKTKVTNKVIQSY